MPMFYNGMEVNMRKKIAIQVKNLDKVYKLYDKPSDRMKEALGLSKKKKYKEHHALDQVNLTIYQGETVGIIGTNGSGKSTILKIITGVLNPSGGKVTVNGRISALLELGAGFNMEYNGIENVYLNGTMIGFSEKEIDEKMQEVQKQASEGSLFGMTEEPAPVIPQPQGSMNGQPRPGMQTSIFPEQQTHTMNPEPVMQSAPQQIPQEMPQPVYGTNGAYIQPAPNRPVMQGTGMPQGATMQPYPQQQVRQSTNGHIPNGTVQVQNGNGREYQTAPATHETFCFDPEDENDRELLREDPYAEYPDFPAEYRMKDEAQVEMVYC